MWIGPTVSMLQSMHQTNMIGTAVSLFILYGGVLGGISTFLIGILSDYYDTDENPSIAGILISICIGISYIG